MMLFPVAKKAIDTFFPDRQVVPRIGFFGGEPLLNWHLMYEVTRYVQGRAYPNPARFHVTTNGVLLSKEKAQFLADNNYSLIVSLDGPKEIHDELRVDQKGEGTFDRVMGGLEFLRSVGLGPRITLRATYTPDTAHTLVIRAGFLNALVSMGYANHVSIEPAFLTETACVDTSFAGQGVTVETVTSLEEEYLRVADWYIEEARAGKRPVFHNITKIIERLLWRLPNVSECGGGKGYFAVNGKGETFCCHREQNSRVGNLVTGIDPVLQAPWIDNRLYCREGCMSCSIRYVCGGGCREHSIGEFGDIHKPSPVECKLKWCFVNAAIWILAELGPDKLKAIVPEPRRQSGPPRVGEVFNLPGTNVRVVPGGTPG